jgi:23S rRNA pseudouridine1911/1915/1917 synthase
VHLAERGGTPLLGDPLYGKRPGDDALRAIASRLGRQALHATVLGFQHPITGEHLRFESELPPDIRHALDELRALG